VVYFFISFRDCTHIRWLCITSVTYNDLLIFNYNSIFLSGELHYDLSRSDNFFYFSDSGLNTTNPSGDNWTSTCPFSIRNFLAVKQSFHLIFKVSGIFRIVLTSVEPKLITTSTVSATFVRINEYTVAPEEFCTDV